MTNTVSQAAERPGAQTTSGRGRQRAGLLYGLGAYTIWGFIPIYFHALTAVPTLIVLCHRICWSALFLALVVSVRGEWKALGRTLRRRRNALLLAAGALFIALNWLIFIYAVATQRLLQASLGYFINPLLSMVLGMVFFRERLRRWQWVAVLAAVGALVNLALRSGGFPWIAAALAGSFGCYGLVRKAVDIDSLHGLTVEAGLLVPVALGLACVLPSGRVSLPTLGLLSLSGVITAVPLLSFGAALRRLRLSTVGFLQYWGPTLQFLVAWRLFHEPLEPAKARSFVLSWVAIGIYVADSLLSRQPQLVADEPE